MPTITLKRIVQLVLLLGAAYLSGLIVWAFTQAPFWASFGHIMSMPWGYVSLVDLYLGFLCTYVVIYLNEPSKKIAFLWMVAIFFLGNLVTALWVVFWGFKKLQHPSE
jgi:hypothetical protein